MNFRWGYLPVLLIMLISGFLAGEQTIHVNTVELKLPCTVRSGPAGIKTIEVWVTLDDGQTWKKHSEKNAAEPTLAVTVETDGVYGFSTVVIGKSGRKEAPPKAGVKPDMTFVVDTRAPQVALTSSSGTTLLRSGESVEVSWKVQDVNLDVDQCIALFSDDGGDTWKRISDERAVTGSKSFVGSAYINPAVFKVIAADKAGNRAVDILAFSVQSDAPAQPEQIVAAPAQPETVKEPIIERIEKSGPMIETVEPETPGETEVIAEPVPETAEPTNAEQVEKPAAVEAVEKPVAVEKPETPAESDGPKQKISILTDGFYDTVIEVDEEYIANTDNTASEEPGTMVIIDKGKQPIPGKRKPVEPEPVPVPVNPEPVMPEPIQPVAVKEAVSGKAVAYCDKAIDLEVFGNLDNASKYYLAALKLEPKYYRARKGLADLYVQQEKFSHALKHYTAILQINPDDLATRVSYGFCLYRSGDMVSAEKELKRILALNPQNVDSMWYLSKIYKDRKMLKDAIFLWVKIINLGPENNKWYDFSRNYMAIYSGTS